MANTYWQTHDFKIKNLENELQALKQRAQRMDGDLLKLMEKVRRLESQ